MLKRSVTVEHMFGHFYCVCVCVCVSISAVWECLRGLNKTQTTGRCPLISTTTTQQTNCPQHQSFKAVFVPAQDRAVHPEAVVASESDLLTMMFTSGVLPYALLMLPQLDHRKHLQSH